uniref:Uncharacterized protein n=1 Tax=Aureoumbra lagunensis TaxID=44058 RepID=A0A7S3NQW6_9STRA|mmetsp:Transcript_9237/g.14226  ORF Transcript_9237/g.14226 Transcript_9237/m.14226 type:complete len:157 (+) Transcript_9237:24-494(+)
MMFLFVCNLVFVNSFVVVERVHNIKRRVSVKYEPSPVEPEIIAQQLAVIGVSLGAALFWWRVTVPEKRLELSRSKKAGEVKEYLDKLETNEERQFEKWLLNDWINPNKRKEPALPFLPDGKFNSGDNPILAAGALILAAGLANALAERGSAFLFHS